MTWIYTVPAWVAAVAAIAVFSAVAAATVFAVHLFVPSRERQSNEVAGPIAGVVGTILAVLLSFMLVVAWQEYDQAAQTASSEATAAVDLGHVADAFPTAKRNELHRLLRRYAAVVVTIEWPSMRAGGESPQAGALAFRIFHAVAAYQPATPAAQAVQSDALGLATAIVDARRDRLFDNQQGIPGFFYAGIGVIVAAAFVICACFTVRRFLLHAAMAAAIGAVVAIVLVLIAEFDYPFRGDTQIPPSAWTRALSATQHE